MADYWKSQPRKFCQYCKCWIADNKPSVEFHERGKNHKENVAAKITEIKKKSMDKLKQEQKQDKQFQAMEEAANKAYQEDLKRMEREAAGLDSPAVTTTATPTQPPPRAKPQASKPQQRKEKFSKRPRNQSEAPVWVEGQTDDGHTYYYNAMTGESRWDKPGESSASAQPPQTESPSSCPWMEAVSPDGHTYYYNAETGESSWEKPADFASIEASERGSKREAEGQQEEPETPQPEPLSGGEDSCSGAPVAATEEGGSEPAGQQTTVPTISFRKRKAEGEPSEKEGEDEVIDDSSPKEEKTDAEEVKKEGELQSTTAPPEEKKEDKKPPPEMSRAKKPKNPYGVWEQIKEEEDPFSKVDLQLPQVEWSTVSAPANVPPEPKPKFKERMITSLGEDGGTATTFRKNKTQNGKSRRLRQRDDDDDDD